MEEDIKKDNQEGKDSFEQQGFIKTNIPGVYIDPKSEQCIHDLVYRPIRGGRKVSKPEEIVMIPIERLEMVLESLKNGTNPDIIHYQLKTDIEYYKSEDWFLNSQQAKDLANYYGGGYDRNKEQIMMAITIQECKRGEIPQEMHDIARGEKIK